MYLNINFARTYGNLNIHCNDNKFDLPDGKELAFGFRFLPCGFALDSKNTKACAPLGVWNIKKMYLCRVRPWEWPQRQKN